jgi:hypothetical protein
VERAREVLRTEIHAFAQRFGPSRSVCPHGDTRIPKVRNAELLRSQDCAEFGIKFDGNEVMRGRPLGRWLTDRSTAEGGWADGVGGAGLLGEGVSPILCVVHPNNWVSGPSLWADRMVAAVLPGSGRGRLSRPIRTGPDAPPDE